MCGSSGGSRWFKKKGSYEVARCLGLDNRESSRNLSHDGVLGPIAIYGAGAMRSAPVRWDTLARRTATMTDAPPEEISAATLTALPREVFAGGEIVLLAVKPSMWRPVWDALPWVGSCIILAIMLSVLRATIAGLSVVATSQAVLLIAVARLGLAIVHWIPTWYVLTNRRVMTIRGIRRPKVKAYPLLDIREVHPCAAPFEKLIQIGTIRFVTDDSDGPTFYWESVVHPDQVLVEVNRAIRDARRGPGSGAPW